MKNRKLIIRLVITLLFLISPFYVYENYWGKPLEWNINWGFKVPQPSKLTAVYEIGGFQDYEGYHIGEYSDWNIGWAKNSKSWDNIGDNNFDTVSKRVEEFKKGTVDISDPDETEHYNQLFKNNPIVFDKNSLWYWKKKKEDHYFLAILNPKTKKLFVMERAF